MKNQNKEQPRKRAKVDQSTTLTSKPTKTQKSSFAKKPVPKESVDTPKRPSSSSVKGKPFADKKTKKVTQDVEKLYVQAAVSVKATAVSWPTTFKVVAGSYEKLLYGLQGSFHDEDDKPTSKLHLKPLFIFPAHVSCVKAVAASPDGGKWLATGSSDEIIKVWDLRRRKEIGGLVQHEGSITHLSFPSRSYLVSGSEDGTICLFRARDWVLLRTLKGHKGHVNSIAVHPSGKVGLSVGKDRTLRMWDWMRGKGSASTKLGKEGEIVRWSTKGDLFAVQSQSTIDVYSSDMVLLHTLTHPSRLHDIKFCRRVEGDGELLLAAAEDKMVTVYAIEDGTNTTLPIVAELTGHLNRVKAVDTLTIALPRPSESGRSTTTIVSTVSSDGWFRIFDLASIPPPTSGAEKAEVTPIAAYDTKGTRLTCCALSDGEAATAKPISGKRKKGANDVEGEDGENAVSEDEDTSLLQAKESGEDSHAEG